MWDDIGGKIKGLAKFIAWLGIIVSIIGGIILFIIGGNQSYGGGIYIGIGFATMIFGSLVSWIMAWFMYGFGELIEKTTEIEKNIRKEGASLSYVSPSFSNIPPIKTSFVGTILIALNSITLKDNVTENATVILNVEKGEKLKYISSKETSSLTYYFVETNDGKKGYCPSNEVKKYNDNP